MVEMEITNKGTSKECGTFLTIAIKKDLGIELPEYAIFSGKRYRLMNISKYKDNIPEYKGKTKTIPVQVNKKYLGMNRIWFATFLHGREF